MTAIVVDTSAVVAIVTLEDDAPLFAAAIDGSLNVSMSAATFVECGVVCDRRGSVPSRNLDRFISRGRIEIIDLTVQQARIARTAYRDFGRGSGHPARLDYGDCFSYALAIDRDEPLLFKGDDFVHTDVRVARPEVTDR